MIELNLFLMIWMLVSEISIEGQLDIFSKVAEVVFLYLQVYTACHLVIGHLYSLDRLKSKS